VFLVLPVRWLPYAGALALAGYLVLCAMGGSVLLDQSARERVVFWGYGNMAFKHNPIFGIGYGMFTELYEDRAAHNAFVTCYTDLGLFGYWFWFNLLQLGMLGTWRTSPGGYGARRRTSASLPAAMGSFSDAVASASDDRCNVWKSFLVKAGWRSHSPSSWMTADRFARTVLTRTWTTLIDRVAP